ETYDATKAKQSCMQVVQNNIPDKWRIKDMSEDCLFLNIWQPKDVQGKSKLPVMFWIHGGAFAIGSVFTQFYNASYIATLGEVIVVSTNYRLSAFGFLYGGTEDAPGNVGYHDQMLALKWVKDNIASFGGNPNTITIFGESAGGVSVGAHVLSPLSNGLFQRAILQSGAPISVDFTKSKEASFIMTNDYAKTLNCNNTLISEQLKCLRNKSANE